MLKFITLTKKDGGGKVLINPNKIVWIEPSEDGSFVMLDEDYEGYFKESIDTIASLIELATIDWSK